MKTILNLTTASAALVLFATTLIMPMQANAADRQISVEAKTKNFKAFKVQDTNQENEVASVEEQQPPKRVTAKSFRVDEAANDQPTSNEEVVTEANTEPKFTPKKPRKPFPKQFRVPAESDQADTTPADDEVTTPAPKKLPTKILTKKIKIVEQAPVENEEETAAAEEDKLDAIAADQPEEATAEAEADVQAEEEPVIVKKVAKLKQRKAYIEYQDIEDDYGYQEQSYNGSSCHNNNNYSY